MPPVNLIPAICCLAGSCGNHKLGGGQTGKDYLVQFYTINISIVIIFRSFPVEDSVGNTTMSGPSDLPYSMKMIFKHVVTTPLGSDPRTNWGKGIILGNSHEVNRRDVLHLGRADFSTGYQQDGASFSCT